MPYGWTLRLFPILKIKDYGTMNHCRRGGVLSLAIQNIPELATERVVQISVLLVILLPQICWVGIFFSFFKAGSLIAQASFQFTQ